MAEINFSTDNDAFAGEPATEICRILRQIARRIEHGEFTGGIVDANGNKIGEYDVGEDSP